ncbi:Flavonol synthase [Rhynchospora pubera]|uniref:anthocyanidin synthase n=1 Tax=Rhynchospora pubera TaxID=906938 RepID=A0AAV8HP79_9POAL|nr:Flavonol synthase [Rhynchospora pubera]
MERLQCVTSVSKEAKTIPVDFIRSVDEQPGITTSHGPVPAVPVIDMANTKHDQIIDEIVKASQEWGIFQVVNHGIPPEAIQQLQRVGKEFFELPQEEKEKVAMVPGQLEGYGTKMTNKQEGPKNWVDFLFHNIWPPSQINHDFWPKNPPEYRNANEEYVKHMIPLVDQLLEYLSSGLGLDGNVLKAASGGDDLRYLLKINYYPPCPCPDMALGVSAHTDMSAITLLVPNEVQGLQVFKDDHWINAKYIPNAMIIHIGDQIEILSNGKYKGVLHRTTVKKDETRMSWPVFCEPPPDTVIGPLPQFVSDKNPAKFKAKKFKDYQYCKLNKIPQ